ncbi:MAG TPA: M67 family metallopeptidase [Rhizomicrobium sp.]|nr:M67 family metallopeptidase [Rhizomicrobium sp.]
MKFVLSQALQQQIAAEARATFPRECCGLLEGDGVQAVALHIAKNISKDDDRFEIDPADHVRAQKAARANGHAIVGCYHSHPNGHAGPSPRDGDSEDGFLWLIAAVSGSDVSLSAFRRVGDGWQRLEIAENPG